MLHNDVNVLNAKEFYIQKWLKWYILYYLSLIIVKIDLIF